jgi:uncharacterized membrane protein
MFWAHDVKCIEGRNIETEQEERKKQVKEWVDKVAMFKSTSHKVDTYVTLFSTFSCFFFLYFFSMFFLLFSCVFLLAVFFYVTTYIRSDMHRRESGEEQC